MEYLAICLVSITFAVVGFLAGILIGTNRMRKGIEERSVGHLRIDRSEPDEPPRPFLEVIGSDIDSISKKDFIVLKVINKNYLSRD